MNTKDIIEALTGADILAKIHPCMRKGLISSSIASPGDTGDPIKSMRNLYVNGKTYRVCVEVVKE